MRGIETEYRKLHTCKRFAGVPRTTVHQNSRNPVIVQAPKAGLRFKFGFGVVNQRVSGYKKGPWENSITSC